MKIILKKGILIEMLGRDIVAIFSLASFVEIYQTYHPILPYSQEYIALTIAGILLIIWIFNPIIKEIEWGKETK